MAIFSTSCRKIQGETDARQDMNVRARQHKFKMGCIYVQVKSELLSVLLCSRLAKRAQVFVARDGLPPTLYVIPTTLRASGRVSE